MTYDQTDRLVGDGWVRLKVGSQRATDEYLLHPTRPWLKADLARTDGSAQIDLTFYEIVADFCLSMTHC